MTKVDLSKCGPGDILLLNDNITTVSFTGFTERTLNRIKVKVAMCSDGIYRTLDGQTPYGVEYQDIKAIINKNIPIPEKNERPSETEGTFATVWVHSNPDIGIPVQIEVLKWNGRVDLLNYVTDQKNIDDISIEVLWERWVDTKIVFEKDDGEYCNARIINV